MSIIQIHNYYQQAGGEDAVVAAERSMLEERGNIVVPFYKNNDEISSGCDGVWGRKAISLLNVSLKTIWNHQTYREFRRLLQDEQPDVVHCHNTFPLISPSVYWACAKEKVPVVQTLHNYRLLCATPFLFRQSRKLNVKTSRDRDSLNGLGDARESPASPCNGLTAPKGAICELCVGKRIPFSALRYRCYRNSLAGTAVWAVMIVFHRIIGTWTKKVTAYIALTEFQKRKMVEGGLPEQKIWVKPNFLQKTNNCDANRFNDLNDVLTSISDLTRGQPYALFVGRLSPEKGCDVLIRAWHEFSGKWLVANEEKRTQLPEPISTFNDLNAVVPQLFIVGDGPEREVLEALTSDLGLLTSVHFLGQQSKERVLTLMRHAQFLVLPSLWYEGFPMTIVEAFSQECAVLASDIGSMTSVIEDGRTGILFRAGSAQCLAEKLEWLFSCPGDIRSMGEQAGKVYRINFSEKSNVKELLEIYSWCFGL